MPTPLDFSKPVQTRNGRPVRILCTDRKHPYYTVIGLIEIDGVDTTKYWTEDGHYFSTRDGHYFSTRKENYLDLIQAPQPRKHAELIKTWADDDSVRVKRVSHSGWIEDHYPVFHTDVQYEEILPSDPLY